MCVASALTGVIVVIYSFAGYIPKYRCRIPYCEGQSSGTYFDDNGTFPEYVIKGNLILFHVIVKLHELNILAFKY